MEVGLKFISFGFPQEYFPHVFLVEIPSRSQFSDFPEWKGFFFRLQCSIADIFY